MAEPARQGNDAANGDGTRYSRRDILVGAGGLLAGGAIGTGVTIAVTDDGTTVAPATEAGPDVPAGAPLQSFTVEEAETVEAVVARLIPSDDDGPGGAEAGVVRFIDRALAAEARGDRPVYQAGLRALDAYAEDTNGDRFAALGAEEQDEILSAFAEGEADEGVDTGTIPEGAVPTPSGFFATIREHALQGMFGDPVYGGNADFAGWELLGYPGVKMTVPPEDQELDEDVDPARRSAYSYESVGNPEEDDG